MNNRMYFNFLTVLLLLPCALVADSTSKTAVANCGSDAVQCTATVNATGDFENIDVSRYEVTDLGTIRNEKNVTVELPKDPGTQTVYSLIPTQGESKDKKIFVVFDNKKERRGSLLADKNFIKIYRRFAPEKATSWREVGSITIEAKVIPRIEASLTLKPDATAIWIDQTGKPEVFELGKKDLGRSKNSPATAA